MNKQEHLFYTREQYKEDCHTNFNAGFVTGVVGTLITLGGVWLIAYFGVG